MDVTIQPKKLGGELDAIASKSMAHRLLICAAFADKPTELACNAISQDIEATAACLNALGATVKRTREGYSIVPVTVPEKGALLDCGESGSTLRFMLPMVAALGCSASLTGHGRLAARPLSPLYEQLEANGCTLGPQGTFPLEVRGRLTGGTFRLAGDVSSQFVTGLLLAAPLLPFPLEVLVGEPVQSRPYIDLTARALENFGVHVNASRGAIDGRTFVRFTVQAADAPRSPEPQGRRVRLRSPGTAIVEGDWSNAAFWIAAAALGGDGITLHGLSPSSAQGDRAIAELACKLGARTFSRGGDVTCTPGELRGIEIDVGDTPDLVPPLAATASVARGMTSITNAARLRLKESDRLQSVAACVNALGGKAEVQGDSLLIVGVPELSGGTVDSAGDHRIAMMGAVAAVRAAGPVLITGAQCVSKSYPTFFDDYEKLGGSIERRA